MTSIPFCTLSMFAFLGAALPQTPPDPTPECPQVCAVDPIWYDSGPQPTGILVLKFDWSTDGIGDYDCHTCVPCKASAIFEWHAGPGEDLVYSRDGGHTWAGAPDHVGPVNVPLQSHCADPDPDKVDVIVYSPNGTYDRHLVLECYCDQ